MKQTYYTCRIDTNKYADNFEREMVAFITGAVGDCGVGQECADTAEKELTEFVRDWFDEYIISTSDEHGCCRPAEIVSTPGLSNYQSVQMRFDQEIPEIIKTLIDKRAHEFLPEDLKITNVEFFKVEVSTTITSLRL